MILEPFGGRMKEISESEIPFPQVKTNADTLNFFRHEPSIPLISKLEV